MDGMAAMCLGS